MRNVEIIRDVDCFFNDYWDDELRFAIIADYDDARDFINIGIRFGCELSDCSEFTEEDNGPYIISIDERTIWVQPAFTDPEKYVGDKMFVFCEADYYFIDAEYAYDYIEDYPHVEGDVFPMIIGEPEFDEGGNRLIQSDEHGPHHSLCIDEDNHGFCFCYEDETGRHQFRYKGTKFLDRGMIGDIINTDFLGW